MEYTLNHALMTSNLEPAALKMENKILPIDSHFAKAKEKILGLGSHSVLLSNPYVAELNIKAFLKITFHTHCLNISQKGIFISFGNCFQSLRILLDMRI